jgi:hypothetical protein
MRIRVIRGYRFLISALVGVAFAIGLGVVAFAMRMLLPTEQGSNFFDPFGMYFWPGGILIPILGRLLPMKLMYWLFPDGGAPAGVFLIVLSALLFWAILFGVAHFVWSSARHKQGVARSSGA